jgi:hypothetical protein
VLHGIAGQKLGEISSSNAIRLLHYHHLCGQEVAKLTKNFTWLRSAPFAHTPCSNCGTKLRLDFLYGVGSYGEVPHWWCDYISVLGDMIAKQPDIVTLSSYAFFKAARSSLSRDSMVCLKQMLSQSQYLGGFIQFNSLLQAEIQKKLDTVSLLETCIYTRY